MAVLGGADRAFPAAPAAGQELAQVLLTLGLSFIIADLCLMIWSGDPIQPSTPPDLQGAVQALGICLPDLSPGGHRRSQS